MDDTRVLPQGFRWQVGRDAFDFEIVTKSHGFNKYSEFAQKKGLICNVCRDDTEISDQDDYLYVVQKSQLWLRLRSEADGTASSVGKYIKGPPMYPTIAEISEHWTDNLNKVPFQTTHTMRGHMRWGVGYEDPALVHFAVDNMVSVCQVGTIYTPLDYIISLIPKYFTETEQSALTNIVQRLRDAGLAGKHLLVSPDGVVGTPDGAEDELPQNIVGMLEIKCISPFHYMEEKDETLSWVDDMETRQWRHAGEIPYVYITQICLQAISGLYRLDMTDDDTMWFVRWSPSGFSEFKIPFGPLVRFGILSSLVYFSLKGRITLENLPLQYDATEYGAVKILNKDYSSVLSQMTHRYVSLDGLYPEFFTYQECTKRFRFRVQGNNA